MIEFGKWDYRELAHHSEEKQAEFWKYFEQMVRRQQKGAEMNNGQGMVEIVDWEGFELNHHASPKGESIEKLKFQFSENLLMFSLF